MKRSAFVTGVALLYAAPTMVRAETSAEALVTDLIGVLNAHDDARMLAFVESRCTTDVPASTRAQRFATLAGRGPFTFVRFEPGDGPNVVAAAVIDGSRTTTHWRLEHNGAVPPRLARLGILAGEGGPPQPPVEWKSLDELVRKVRSGDGSPALVATVVQAGRRDVAVAGTRTLAGVAAAADDPFKIGSIGKPICSTVIGRLIESGALHWDTKLADVLTDIPKHQGYAAVTLEQIMRHRGGIPQDENFRRADVDRIAGDAKTATAMRLNYARDILGRAPIGAPGERFAYSNAGYALLGAIAEAASRKSYEELVRDDVFAPLGLKRSFVGDVVPDPHPTGHRKTQTGFEPFAQGGPLAKLLAPAGGGIWMSAADLAAFGAAHLAGLRGADGLLRAATVARLHQGVGEGGGGDRLYACGWGIEPIPGAETMHGHNGSDGTFRAQLGIFPKANVVVAALSNAGAEDGIPSAPHRVTVEAARRYAAVR